MTLPQFTSWAFLFAIALGFTVVLHGAETPQAAPTKAAQTSFKQQRSVGLIVPVARVGSRDLVDTWGAARSEGRSHKGIDIMAAQGTPVLAAVDGRIVKFHDSERGGVTIYQFDRNERFVYYYAHLQARADDLAEGDEVRQGDVIGFVGATGNATTPHLHFEVSRLTDEKKWWRAESVNPYPLLRAGETPT